MLLFRIVSLYIYKKKENIAHEKTTSSFARYLSYIVNRHVIILDKIYKTHSFGDINMHKVINFEFSSSTKMINILKNVYFHKHVLLCSYLRFFKG